MNSFLAIDSELIKFEGKIRHQHPQKNRINRIHFISVEQNTNYHCIVCKAEFLTRESRNEHLETHFIHRNCEHCHKAVIIIGDLEFELHRPSHCYKQESCDGSFSSLAALNVEIIHDDDAKISYVEEEDSPKSKPLLEIELSEESDVPIKTYKRQSPRKRAKKANKFRHDAESEDDAAHSMDNEITVRTETDSDFDAFKQVDVEKKKRRRRYAKLPKTIPCKMCDALFGSERTLKIHMNQVHGIKERYICPICSREFKISGNLKQHIETHSDHKRFICNYCGKGFHLPYNLKEHMNTHTGARPYKCEICDKTFGRNTLRQAHMRVSVLNDGSNSAFFFLFTH